jgi:nucleotide-binding universal stress UspA family protein
MTAIETRGVERSYSSSKPPRTGPTIVVATDGSDASSEAFAAAGLIAAFTDADIRANPVFDSSLGDPAAEVAQASEDHRAGLIIVGARHDSASDRTAREAMVVRIAKLARTPVLIASPGMRRLPHRVGIAIDLDPSQLGDLPPVLSLFGPAPSVTCLHVQKHEEFPGSDSPIFVRAYESSVAESLAVVRSAIAKVPGMRADLIRLSGDPATELLRYAEYARIELLVLGLGRHYGQRGRCGGSVALRVLRDALFSVLIVPETVGSKDRMAQRDKSRQGVTHTSYDAAMWPSLLKQFTQRNAGRHATLEVEGPAIGALVQVLELPFMGADYDHRDQRVDILFGDFAGGDRHFTRSIPAADSISVLRAEDNRDYALCVTYEGAQTLLTFRV